MKTIAIVHVFFLPLSSLCGINFEIIIQERDVDLLLVDSGDLHDGMYACQIVNVFQNIHSRNIL